jgi:hypothetical protein
VFQLVTARTTLRLTARTRRIACDVIEKVTRPGRASAPAPLMLGDLLPGTGGQVFVRMGQDSAAIAAGRPEHAGHGEDGKGFADVLALASTCAP